MTSKRVLLHVLDADSVTVLDLFTQLVRRLGDRGWTQVFVCLDPHLRSRAGALLARPVDLAAQRLRLPQTAAISLRRYIGRRQISLIHCWGRSAAIASRMAAPNIPLCVTLGDFAPRDKLSRWLQAVQSSSTAVVACEGMLRLRLVQAGAALENCVLIRPAVDSARLPGLDRQRLREELAMPTDALVLLIPGPPSRPGGHYYGLWAGALMEKVRCEVRVVIPGVSGELARLRRFARDVGSSGMLLGVGERYDWPELIGIADVVVAPFVGEVPSAPLGWAMAAGVPVVASAIPVVADIISSGKNGLLVRPGDPLEISRQVLRIINDQALRRRLVDGGRSRYRELFDSTACFGAYDQVYANLLAARRPAHGVSDILATA